MLGKPSIVGAVAATLMIPAGLSAQPYGGPYVPSPAARGVVLRHAATAAPAPRRRVAVRDRRPPRAGRPA